MKRCLEFRTLRILPLLFLLVAATPSRTEAADSGAIGATVTGAAPCITVSGSFDFGTLPFTQPGITGSGTAGPATATNCGAQGEVFMARISPMTNGSASWTASRAWNACFDALNVYALNLFVQDPDPFTILGLDGTDRTFLSNVPAASSHDVRGTLSMPCTGSVGAGLQMSSTITLTATF